MPSVHYDIRTYSLCSLSNVILNPAYPCGKPCRPCTILFPPISDTGFFKSRQHFTNCFWFVIPKTKICLSITMCHSLYITVLPPYNPPIHWDLSISQLSVHSLMSLSMNVYLCIKHNIKCTCPMILCIHMVTYCNSLVIPVICIAKSRMKIIIHN